MGSFAWLTAVSASVNSCPEGTRRRSLLEAASTGQTLLFTFPLHLRARPNDITGDIFPESSPNKRLSGNNNWYMSRILITFGVLFE
ncbi:hypothetical protein SAMN05444359_12319 [Neolewinella agarilytica]|uniref:Uncharacterized protein n=1 Tax=Neolewinella agarilytica TaxID=478744 RepID=A0A1H9L6W2_9BACT|nr:hypothetical protein SAMN05444359_12319 [Neolewinella agarilytica]